MTIVLPLRAPRPPDALDFVGDPVTRNEVSVGDLYDKDARRVRVGLKINVL